MRRRAREQVVRVQNVTGTSLTLAAAQALTPGHSYTWFVGVASTKGQAETWSPSQQFTIPSLTAPTTTARTPSSRRRSRPLPGPVWPGDYHYDLQGG